MSELAEASGVSAGTIKHYLREGLLPEPVKTSRNMAYYPPEFVERIRLIKQLQEERFMPLKAIKCVLDEDPERARALVELEDRILERALQGEQARVSRRRGAPPLRHAAGGARPPREIEVLYAQHARLLADATCEIIEAISRFRAGGYDERIGFTVYDTLRYKRALEALVKEEVEVLLERLAGEIEPDRAVELIEAGRGAAARPDRRAALQAAGGRAGAAARRPRVGAAQSQQRVGRDRLRCSGERPP